MFPFPSTAIFASCFRCCSLSDVPGMGYGEIFLCCCCRRRRCCCCWWRWWWWWWRWHVSWVRITPPQKKKKRKERAREKKYVKKKISLQSEKKMGMRKRKRRFWIVVGKKMFSKEREAQDAQMINLPLSLSSFLSPPSPIALSLFLALSLSLSLSLSLTLPESLFLSLDAIGQCGRQPLLIQ